MYDNFWSNCKIVTYLIDFFEHFFYKTKSSSIMTNFIFLTVWVSLVKSYYIKIVMLHNNFTFFKNYNETVIIPYNFILYIIMDQYHFIHIYNLMVN